MNKAFYLAAFALSYLFIAAVTVHAETALLVVSPDQGLHADWVNVQTVHFAVGSTYHQVAATSGR